MAAAGKNQDEVIQSLETILGELSQWDNYRRFHREVGQLRRDQEDVNRETAEVGRQTLTKNLKDLDPQQQADLKKIAGRQLELARRFDKIQQRMQRMQGELDQSDPLSAGAIADALQQSREQAVAEQMRRAGAQLQDNQVGQAASGQKQVEEDLQEMLDILANRRESELARLVKKLREAEGKLQTLHRARPDCARSSRTPQKRPTKRSVAESWSD